MEHLPVFADLKGRPCLVVGGGAVAERKVRQLLAAGAPVTVVSPELTRQLEELARDGMISHRAQRFEDRLPDEFWLVIAATNDTALNGRVARAAGAAKRLCNVVDDPALCSFIMPAIIDRAPMTIAISSGGRAPVLARWVKGIIESALPMRLGELASLAGRWRRRVREAIQPIDQRRRFWERVLEGPVAEHVYAGRDTAAHGALDRALAEWQSGRDRPSGEAYLVGAGPGSADLLTIRGRQLLSQAEVVLYDRLVGAGVLEFARRDAELICVGKTPGQPSITQEQINRLLVQLVASGKRVCRLKGGDPLVFGRGGEELEALAEAGLPFQVVPGISAVEGCAAYAGIPLTVRGMAHSVVLTTGRTAGRTAERPLAQFAGLAPGQTLALYMGVADYPAIARQLIAQGADAATPVAVVERGTTPEQRVVSTELGSLGEAAEALEVRSPALLLVGETARFSERYGWFAPERLVIYKRASQEDASEEASLARAG
jgi:uroporphyrin-III C-methyltransferase/precorrin-2 dehydrogenase/sirohydrochlorin ferrochelatase